MSVFDCFTQDWQEGDYLMAEPVSIDLTTDDGFSALERHAHETVYHLYGTQNGAWQTSGWQSLDGRTLDEIADALAVDFMQESVSLPRGAFADPAQAGREMAIIKRVYRYVARAALRHLALIGLDYDGAPFPSGHTTGPRQPSQQHRQRLQNHSQQK